jgi:beta-galactosidase
MHFDSTTDKKLNWSTVSEVLSSARMPSDSKKNKRPVSFDERALLIGGRRELLISGEVHYPRVPEEEWEKVLDTTKAAGVNCIASYVFWNLHEPKKDCYDFRDGKNLPRFLSLCRDRGLFVILRAGPYCCAEWNYGGFPLWLREELGIKLRTWNGPYLQRVEKYLRHLFEEVQPYLATQGGAVVMVQLENEYSNIGQRYKADGHRYLAWILELGRKQGIDVPVVMCEGAAKGALEAFNGFSISETRILEFRQRRTDQPLMWTELWPGWYDTWSRQHHVRDARNIGYHLLRFVAAGGTVWNYYMWHGGTNFGRTSMYLQVNSYDFDAPLDEWGRLTRKGAYLSALHKLIGHKKSLLLNGKRIDSPSQAVWTNRGKELRIAWKEQERRAALSDENGKVLFDTEEAWKESGKVGRSISAWRLLDVFRKWKWTSEPLPSARTDAGVDRAKPQDQLLLTKDDSDYCWYSHALTIRTSGEYELRLPFCGDFLRIYINERPVAHTTPPMKECRGPTHAVQIQALGDVNPLERGEPEYSQNFQIFLQGGRNRIDILCCALGLIKGDWMISGPMTNERKGIWSDVYLNEKPLLGWQIRAGLAKGLSNGVNSGRSKFLGWWETGFSVNRQLLSGSCDFRLDLAGWEKGMVYINERLLGRYWLIEADGYGPDEPGHETDNHGLRIEGAGQPTQRFYRIPSSWLDERNTLRLFEEGVTKTPTLARIDYRKAL